MEDRKNSSIDIGFHTYKPKGSKGIFPIKILSYEIPTKFLQTKGGPKEKKLSKAKKFWKNDPFAECNTRQTARTRHMIGHASLVTADD